MLAHVAARLDLPFAANVTEVRGDEVTRVRWGGSLLEEARVHAPVKLLTVAPHAVAAEAAGGGEKGCEPERAGENGYAPFAFLSSAVIAGTISCRSPITA